MVTSDARANMLATDQDHRSRPVEKLMSRYTDGDASGQ
jgi:hypothetical protein